MNGFTRRLARGAFAIMLSLVAISPVGQVQAHEIKAGALVIHHPWIRQSPMKADVAAGFMIITNTGKEDERLVSVSAPDLAPVVQIHTMKMQNDVMKMEELKEGIVIPAGATVELKPKSLHIMFLQVKSQPMEGQEVPGTLVFERQGQVNVDFEVTNPDAGMN